jgi:hypothetical protein
MIGGVLTSQAANPAAARFLDIAFDKGTAVEAVNRDVSDARG